MSDSNIYQAPTPTTTPKQWGISFRWKYEDKLINKRISKEEAARDNKVEDAIIKIGREEVSCNLHLEDGSVSRQHAEIYFDEYQQKFFIKSLQPKNITQVDGQKVDGDQGLPLREGSTIILGQQTVEVTKIEVYEIEPTKYSAIVPYESNLIEVNCPDSSESEQKNSEASEQKNSKPWWEKPGTVFAGLIGTIITATLANVYAPQITHYFSNLQDYRVAFDKHTKQVLDIKLDEKKRPKHLYNVILSNSCKKDVRYAYTFVALDGVRETKGWYTIPGKLENITITRSLEAFAPDALLYLYAEIAKTATEEKATEEKSLPKFGDNNNKNWITYSYDPGKEIYDEVKDNNNYLEKDVPSTSTTNSFNYIDEQFLEPNILNKSPEKFYRIQFDHTNDKKADITKRMFKCDKEGTLELTPEPPYFSRDSSTGKEKFTKPDWTTIEPQNGKEFTSKEKKTIFSPIIFNSPSSNN